MKLLPIGRQDFATLRLDNCVYVDKTEHIHRMLSTGKAYFLSRPRRFGKSVTVSTIKAIYDGQKALFEGLWIEKNWDWSRRNPVIHLAFNSLDYKNFGLDKMLDWAVDEAAKEHGITLNAEGHTLRFDELVKKLAKEKGRVVILIDEYDKPIIDYLEKPVRKQAEENRAILRNFYGPFKSLDPYIEFLFLTGVSKFSQVSIFSHLNHLQDITMDSRFLSLVGYTQTELITYFDDYLKAFLVENTDWTKERLLSKVQEWYNGYSWDGETKVYNPYSILLFLSAKKFQSFWFETGTPTFLVDLIKEQQVFNFNQLKVNAQLINSYDIENLDVRTLFFQTGYLTIKEADSEYNLYVLDYPNREVEEAMSNYIIGALKNQSPLDSLPPVLDIKSAFLQNDVERAVRVINAMLKDVPAQLIKKKTEHFYHALVHLHFRALGLYMDSEVYTSDGRMDAVVKTSSHIYIVEFKLNKSAKIALEQIKSKDYPAKYLSDGRQVIGVGINFNSSKKAIDDWAIEAF
jgi:Predicted AAA-ATPase/PD-(D/E)XK nuclease superfamily